MISGYSDHYRILHSDQLDNIRSEATARPGAVLEKNKKLSAETNKRRKQLEERWKQHEEAEERRRAEVLLARRARLKAATEKYQKSGVPQHGRAPASARQLRSRSSSLPFQLDGTSPRRASTAMDAASAIERALQAIRAEIPTTWRPMPPSASSGGDLQQQQQQQQQQRAAMVSAAQARTRQQLRDGGSSGADAGSSVSNEASGSPSPARASAHINGSRAYAGGGAGARDHWDTVQQQQQHSSSRSDLAARAIFETELAMRHAAEANIQYHDSTLNDRDDFDLLRTSVDSLDEEAHVEKRPLPGGSRGSQPSQPSDSGAARTSGAHAAAVPTASAAGMSRGFSTWRAAEEVASERSQNPHLRTDEIAAEQNYRAAASMAATIAGPAPAVVAIATKGSVDQGQLSASKVPGTLPAPESDLISRAGGHGHGGSNGSGIRREAAGIDMGGSGDFVQWQAVVSQPSSWGHHLGSATRRSRISATPVVAAPLHSGVYLTMAGAGASDSKVATTEACHSLGSSATRAGAEATPTLVQHGILSSERLVTPAINGAGSGHVRSLAGLPAASASGLNGSQFLTVHSLSRVGSAVSGTDLSYHSQHAPTSSLPAGTVAVEEAVSYGHSQMLPGRAGHSGPARMQATTYGIRDQAVGNFGVPAESGRATAALGRQQGAALGQLLGSGGGDDSTATTAVPAFDSGSVYSDSMASLSSRSAVKGILKRSVAGGGADDDISVISVRSERSQDLASSKQRSLSTPNIRDSLEVTKKRTDSGSKPPTPRKKSVRFVDSDSEIDGIGSEGSANNVKNKSDKLQACWISPANVLDIQELQAVIAPMPAGVDTGSARPASASAAAQKPPAPPSARSQRANSAMLAAAARRRGIPAASRLPVHRRWSSDAASPDGNEAAMQGNTTKDNGNIKSNSSAAGDNSGIYLAKTPTDEEINTLWRTVRSCLQQDATSDEPLAAGSATQPTSTTPPASGTHGPVQSTPITKVTTDNLAKLSRTGGHGQPMSATATSPLLLRGRTASDPALAVTTGTSPQPHPYQQQQSAGGSRIEQMPAYTAAAAAATAVPSSSSLSSGGRAQAIIQSQHQDTAHRGTAATANGGLLNGSAAGYAHVDPTYGRNGVTTSMTAFLTAEELSAKPLVSESQISRTMHEVEFFHRPAGMHPVPMRAAHFRRGSAGRAAGVPMSALSLEEQKLLQSLEVLNERLKITEAASAATSTSTPKGDTRLAPQQVAQWPTTAQASAAHRAAMTLSRYPARPQHWAGDT